MLQSSGPPHRLRHCLPSQLSAPVTCRKAPSLHDLHVLHHFNVGLTRSLHVHCPPAARHPQGFTCGRWRVRIVCVCVCVCVCARARVRVSVCVYVFILSFMLWIFLPTHHPKTMRISSVTALCLLTILCCPAPQNGALVVFGRGFCVTVHLRNFRARVSRDKRRCSRNASWHAAER